MSLKKFSTKHFANKKKKIITIELKKEIIKYYERGMSIVDLANK